LSKKIPIARNLSDAESREWWAAIDELAAKAPKLGSNRQPFRQSAEERPGRGDVQAKARGDRKHSGTS
jgi:hypothetical protein